MFPSFHPLQHAFALLRRPIVEAVQAVEQLRLLLRRQLLEIGVALQRVLLLIRRQVLVIAEPVPCVRPGRKWHRTTGWMRNRRMTLRTSFLHLSIFYGAAWLWTNRFRTTRDRTSRSLTNRAPFNSPFRLPRGLMLWGRGSVFLPLFMLLWAFLGVRRGQRHPASERGAEHRPRH